MWIPPYGGRFLKDWLLLIYILLEFNMAFIGVITPGIVVDGCVGLTPDIVLGLVGGYPPRLVPFVCG